MNYKRFSSNFGTVLDIVGRFQSTCAVPNCKEENISSDTKYHSDIWKHAGRIVTFSCYPIVPFKDANMHVKEHNGIGSDAGHYFGGYVFDRTCENSVWIAEQCLGYLAHANTNAQFLGQALIDIGTQKLSLEQAYSNYVAPNANSIVGYSALIFATSSLYCGWQYGGCQFLMGACGTIGGAVYALTISPNTLADMLTSVLKTFYWTPVKN